MELFKKEKTLVGSKIPIWHVYYWIIF